MQGTTPMRGARSDRRTHAEGATGLLEDVDREGPWSAVVWNDPVNLMSYVVYVLRTLFGFSAPTAERLMMQVHCDGRATVARGSLEEMEADVHRLHAWGLRATVEQREQD